MFAQEVSPQTTTLDFESKREVAALSDITASRESIDTETARS